MNVAENPTVNIRQVTFQVLGRGFVVTAEGVTATGDVATMTLACETPESLREAMKKVAPILFESAVIVPPLTGLPVDFKKLPGAGGLS